MGDYQEMNVQVKKPKYEIKTDDQTQINKEEENQLLEQRDRREETHSMRFHSTDAGKQITDMKEEELRHSVHMNMPILLERDRKEKEQNIQIAPLNDIHKLPVSQKVRPLSPEELKERREIYNDKAKEAHEKALADLRYTIPDDRDHLVEIRTNMNERYEFFDEDHVRHEDYRWKNEIPQKVRDHYDWLMEYYKINDDSIEEYHGQDKPLEQLPLKEYHVSVDGVDAIYETQGYNNCFCCSGTAMLNQFIRNRNKEVKPTRRFTQYDMRAYRPKVKKYDPAGKRIMDEDQRRDYIKGIDKYTGADKNAVGNVFELGDFFLDNLQGDNVILNKMYFQMPPMKARNQEKNLIKSNNMKAVFMDKISEVLATGNVVSFLEVDGNYGHYLTITGIDGNKISYLDSRKGEKAPKEKSIDSFLKRLDSKGNPIEITWLSEMKKPEELTAEYSNLNYNAETGFSLKKDNADSIQNVSQTKGIAVKKELADVGPGMDGITQVAYIPNPLGQVESESMEEALSGTHVVRQTEQKMEKQLEQKVEEQLEQKVKTQTEQKVEKQLEQKVETQIGQKVEEQIEQKVEKQTEQKVEKMLEQKTEKQLEQKTREGVKQKKNADRKEIFKYEKTNKDYETFGVGFTLDKVDVTAADSESMRSIKIALAEYLKIRDEVFQLHKFKKNEADAENIQSRRSGNDKSKLIQNKGRKNYYALKEDEREALGNAYEAVSAAVHQYRLTHNKYLSFGRGRARYRQVMDIKNQLDMDNVRFYLSSERRDILKSVDMKYNIKQEESIRKTIMPTWHRAIVMNDYIDVNNQVYRNNRKRQKAEGKLPPWYKRAMEWTGAAMQNNIARIGMLYHGIGGLVDRSLGLATMLAANSLTFAGKVVKAPLKLLSGIFNGASKYIFRSKKRWQVDYSLTKGWKNVDDGRRIFRKYLKGALILPAAVMETMTRGIPYIFGHQFKSGVYKRTGKWSKAIYEDAKDVMKGLGFKDYGAADRADVDYEMAGGITIDAYGKVIQHGMSEYSNEDDDAVVPVMTKKEAVKVENPKEDIKDEIKEQKQEKKEEKPSRRTEKKAEPRTRRVNDADQMINLNNKFENQQIDDFLNEEVQTAYDMKKKKVGSADQLQNLNKTEEDVMNIEALLSRMKVGKYDIDEVEVKQAKLEVVKGRKLSHLMLNDQKLSGDSEEMEKVKNTLADLELAMTTEQKHALSDKNVDALQACYESAIDACRTYCDVKHPKTDTGKRRKAKVQATLARLLAESDIIELGRMIIKSDGSEAKNIKSGMQLLSLTAVQSFADKMIVTGRKREIENEIENIEDLKADVTIKADAAQPLINQKKALYEMKQAEYEAMKADYDALYKRKEEVEKIGWFKLKVGGDEELDNAHQRLKEMESELDDAKYYYEQAKDELKKLVGEKESLDKSIESKKNEYQNAEKEQEKRVKQRKDVERKEAERIGQENEKQLENKISELPEDLQVLTQMISKGIMPSTTIKNKKKIKSSEKKALSDLLLVRETLNEFKVGTAHSKTIRIADKYVRLLQDEFGNVEIQYKKVRVPIAFNAAHTVNMISTDVMNNRKIYGEKAVYDVISDLKTDLSEMTRGDLIRTRDFSTQIIFEVTGVPKTLLNNFTASELKSFALTALETRADKKLSESFKKNLLKTANTRNKDKKDKNINTVLNQELQKVGYKETEGITVNLEQREDQSNWDERERKVRDLVSDMIFSKDTWIADNLVKAPAERMRQMLLDNADAVALIIADQFRDKKKNPRGLVETMLDKLPLFVMGEENLRQLKEEVASCLEEIHSFMTDILDEMEEGFVKNMAKSALENANTNLLVPHIKNALKNLDKDGLKKLTDLDKKIDDAVSDSMEGVQDAFSACIGEIFEVEEDEEEQEVQKEEKEVIEKIEDYALLLDGKTDEEFEESIKNLPPNKQRDQRETRKENLRLYREKKEEIERKDADRAAKKAKEDADNKEKAQINEYKKTIEKLKKEPVDKKSIEEAKRLNALVAAYEKKIRMEVIQKRIDDRADAFKKLEDERKEKKTEYLRYKNMNEDEMSIADKHEMASLVKVINKIDDDLEKMKKKSSKELEKILEDSVKGGKKGQSLFMKNVFQTYFKGVDKLDKRSMIASAIKNSNAIPLMTDEEKKKLTDAQILEYSSSMIGGMFKGAGPLFQKMLQGLPIASLPKGLRKAVEDTQDSLASIPDEVVKAHMDGIKERSAGKITGIEVNKSLGAASVGQAFLCKVYGPGMAEGKNVVIKLLRPDVRNRMMREKNIMLEAARLTDEDGMLPSEVEKKRKDNVVGGMEATYMGNLQRIEEELDLTIEAKNCMEGQVYDNPVYDKDKKKYKENISNSMKLSDLVEATSDTCVMEIAGTKTVKRYMSDINQKITELLWDYCEKEDEVDKHGQKTGKQILKRNEEDGSFVLRDLNPDEKIALAPVIDEVAEILKGQEQKQKALAQVVEKWVTEGVFQKGYYHGDLHAGNIMISDIGVTVIDFGNATILNKEQQKYITKMMVAATQGDVERFRHGFHMLLENTPEEVYQEKRDELTLIFKDIMSIGDESSAAERIAVALVRAQELGLELPPTIANFSSCQMRLQNTLNDMNKSLTATRANLKNLMTSHMYYSNQKNVDPVANYIDSSKNLAVHLKKANARAILMSRGEIDEGSFREELRNQKSREDFRNKNGYNRSKINELIRKDAQKFNDLLSGKLQVTEKYDEEKMDEYFPNLSEVQEMETNPKQVNFYSILKNKAIQLLYADDEMKELVVTTYGKPASFEDFVEKIKSMDVRHKDRILCQEPSETEKRLDAFYKAQDDKKTTPEELKQLEDAVWESFKAEKGKSEQAEKEKQKYLTDFKNKYCPKKTEGVDFELTKKWYTGTGLDLLRRTINSATKNKVNGEQLKKVSEELFELHRKATEDEAGFEENKDALNAKFDEMLDILWEAQTNTIRELAENAKDPIRISKDDPETFLEIMGGVMKDKEYDVIFKLDAAVTAKMIWGIVKDKVVDMFGGNGDE